MDRQVVHTTRFGTSLIVNRREYDKARFLCQESASGNLYKFSDQKKVLKRPDRDSVGGRVAGFKGATQAGTKCFSECKISSHPRIDYAYFHTPSVDQARGRIYLFRWNNPEDKQQTHCSQTIDSEP